MTDDFASNGVLAKTIIGFKPRAVQNEMASAIAETIELKKTLVVEAGTGTGKTFAYLVPALRSKRKVIISTGSKTLQDQLFKRDLPTVVKALKYTGKIALLKGRANYLCLQRLEQQLLMAGELKPQTISELTQLRTWSTVTDDGDISTCAGITEESALWPLVTSNNDNCLGSDCPLYQNCFVVKARRKALDADVIVVNHHLFLADMVVKETGFGELIPTAEVMIFDEAHQLPDIASHYFGQQLSSRQLLHLAKDIIIAYRTEVRDMQQLQKSADRLTHITQNVRLVLGEPGYRGDLRKALQQQNLQRALILLEDALELCYDVTKMSLGRSELLDAAFERAAIYRQRLQRLKEVTLPGYSYWFECTTHHFTLALTPLSVSEKFNQWMNEKPASWIFTSATLSVNEQLLHFTQRLGLADAKTLLLNSPFDYARQTMLCVPRYLPSLEQPNNAQYLAKILQPLIEANGGRCFLLCTSTKMMRELAVEFRANLALPVLVQGEMSKSRLLDQFIDAGNALLVATSSFWEGVDVRGDTLSCVIIDKLPFTAPDDPLLKARVEDCRLRGGDPFYDIQLPEAVIALKQGVGRLIRDSHDRGVIVICDNRLVSRPYGSVFLNSLPPSPRTRDIQQAIDFLQCRESVETSNT